MTSVINGGQSLAVVQAYSPGTPSSASPDYVSLKNAAGALIVISVNNATSVTGSAVTVTQATAVAGTGAKALGFATVSANPDIAAGGLPTETAVTSDTFTTTAVDNKDAVYVIDVHADDLDVAGGFDCLAVGLGNAANTVISATYLLYGLRYQPLAVDPTAD